MPTIISRCQQFNVVSPQLEAGSAWLDGEVGKAVPQYILALNDNAPLKAKAMFEQGGVEASTKALDGFVNVIKGTQPDMLKFSTELSKDPLIQLSWLWHLLSDVQKLHFDLATQAMTPSAKALVEVMSYQNAYAASNKLLILIEQLKQHPGLNTELLIMNWLIATCEKHVRRFPLSFRQIGLSRFTHQRRRCGEQGEGSECRPAAFCRCDTRFV